MGNVSSKLPDKNTFPSTPSSSFSTAPAAGVARSTAPADSSASLSSSTADSPSKDTEKTTTVAKAHRSSVSFSPSTFSSPSSSSIAPPSTRLVPPPTLQSTLQLNNDSDSKDSSQTRSNNNIHIRSGNDNDLASVVKSPHSIEPTTSFTTSSPNTSSNTPMPSPTPASLLDKPLPASPASASASLLLSPSAFPDQETVKPRRSDSLNAHQHPGPSSPGSRISGRVNSLSQQSMHSQSSLSGRSIASNSSGSSGHGSGTSGSGSATRSHNSSANTVTTRTTSISGGPTDSVGQLSLQRFPTGESEYKVRPVSGSSSSTGQSLGAQTKASRTTSVVSTSSARSSSGSSGFKFSFKPLLYNHGNDSKQQHLYHHHNGSSPATSPNGHHQTLDPFATSPFPAILMSIKLPQSLLDKYVIDQESFRHGKGVWGIGKYSWTITVLSRANGKKYVIKRVSKSLLPPSAYYHYPTTAHRLCTCPACKSLREQLLLTGQLPDNELENLQEVLVIHNKGRRKELPQLPPSSPQQSRQHQPQRPLSASSIAPPTSSSNIAKESKEKQRRSFNLYSCHNASTPNHTSKFSAFSPITTPQDTPVNSRPSTPVPSPLRMLSTPHPPPSSKLTFSSSHALSVDQGKIHSSNSSNSSNGITNKSQTAQSSLIPTPSPLLPAETPLSWSQKAGDAMVSQGRPRALTRHNQQQDDAPRSPGIPPRSAGTPTSSQRTRPILQRHASTPNMSRTITGLDVLETDPARMDQLRQLSRLGNHGGGNVGGGVISFGRDRDHRRDPDSRLAPLKGDRPLSDSPLSMTMTMQALYESTLGNEANGHRQDDDKDEGDGREANVEYEKTPTTTTHSALRLQTSMVTSERAVSPFDTNGGEFKQMEPESPESSTVRARNGAASAPLMFTPPPHALPMELVLLQTYNDSDHLPEHHEWTQDEDYWYYVTKAHGVRRRKLKKVSSWWLDLSSLGGALLSAGSSSSHEPIATGPIYNMGRAPGTTSTTPHPSSPLSSELALAGPSLMATDTTRRTHAAKESISSMASQETVNPNSAAFKRQSSPRNSTSFMGKYYYVDWDEYLSL